MTQQDRQAQDIKAALDTIESQSDVSQEQIQKMALTSKLLADIYTNIDSSTKDFKVKKI
jgi:hypothetical protein